MMNETLQLYSIISEHKLGKPLFFTFLLLIFFFFLRLIFLNFIERSDRDKIEKTLLKKKTSHYFLYSLVFAIFLLWFAQLQVFFVSVMAVAAAVVLAFKELIMCLTGGILGRVSNSFKIGDRIEIDGLRGFIIEKNLMTTKVLEIGPEKNSQQTTGGIINIPNSLMLSKSLKNESYFKGYSIKSFIFKIDKLELVEDFEEKVLKVSQEFCSGYLNEATTAIINFCQKDGLIVPSINPKTKVIIENGKEVSVLVKLPVRNSEVADIEQLLNRFYIEWEVSHCEGK